MLRYICRTFSLFLLCGVTLTVCWAQEPLHLTLRAEKIQKARQTEQQALAKNDTLQLAEAWYLYGKAYVFAGDYQTAPQYYLGALRIHEPRGNSPELNRLFVRLSENELILGHLNESLQYAKRSLQVALHIPSDIALIRSYGVLGKVYERLWESQLSYSQTKRDSIRAIYRKELDLCRKLNDTLGVAEASLQLGTFLTRINDRAALPYTKEALLLFTLKNKVGVRVTAMTHLAEAYLKFGKPTLAYQILTQAEQIYTSRKLNEYDPQMGLERNFVRYFETTGQWQKAYNHLGKLNTLERSQILSDCDGAITRLNVEYETGKKEVQLKAQQQEIELNARNYRLQKWFTLLASGLFVIAAGMSMQFFRLNRKNKRISLQNRELVKEQNHRVKNNLQVVSSLLSLQAEQLTDEVAKRAVEESQLRVQTMAILHRRLYDGAQLAAVDLAEFIPELVGGVLSAYGYPRLQPQFTIDEIFLSADKSVPIGLILNELTTNACKYAFPDNENPRLAITVQCKNEYLELTVHDNGTGVGKSR